MKPLPRTSAEHERLREAREVNVPWRKWGPYLSDRQWGTVREDLTPTADAWAGFTHEESRSRAYRWGEDGIAGICDDQMRLCFAPALWNGRDPMLKERLFGLANGEGNHGEDVKEYYFHLDNLPSHAYMRMLYKYPQAAFPYAALVHGNRERGRLDLEYELLDTKIFDEDRYFDVFVEYAKETPEDILIRITIENRGPEAARLHVLPHLWFRNTWWRNPQGARPVLERMQPHAPDALVVCARHPEIGTRYLKCEHAAELLFTDNESNTELLVGEPNASPYVKDGINDYIVRGAENAIDPRGQGTKSAAHYDLTIAAQGRHVLRLRLGTEPWKSFATFDGTFLARQREADDFYASLIPPNANPDVSLVIRQAFAGLLWSKQTYHYDLRAWLTDQDAVPHHGARTIRNRDWFHMVASDVISMPDKWEYPWFAAWDLAFQAIALSFVDPDFAADQLDLLLRERYTHPNGQIPAYEWNFGDTNPPVHAWATLFIYRLQRLRQGERALKNLQRAFHKLLMNFTWWVNRRDRTGRNVFEGGFLGLDNIGLFDRSAPLPAGGYLEQADGNGWMALFSQNMLEMALELALHDPAYEELAIKFYEHFVWIATAMDRLGDHSDEMWDEQDGFFYDVLRFPTGNGARLKVRSMVGLIPLCANTVYPEKVLRKLPRFVERVRWYNRERRDLLQNINHPDQRGVHGRRLLSVLDERKLRLVLKRMLDPEEFLGEYGIRSLSRHHRDHPYVFRAGFDEYQVAYRPAESDSGLFGGNSNWRGPIWFPVNVLIIRALLQLYAFYGDGFRVECPTGSGRFMTLFEVGQDITRRLAAIFLRDPSGRRAVYGGTQRFQQDPHWRDLILFYEYFHGDNGAGLGASHQTGWTALIAPLLILYGDLDADAMNRDLGHVFERIAERCH
jgi:mannosylglycerate hydrolase MGH1-like protein